MATEAATMVTIGDEVRYTPHDRRRACEVIGFVANHVSGFGGDTGYELLAPLPGDPTRMVRVWLSRGVVVPTGQVAAWKPAAPPAGPASTPAAVGQPSSPASVLPYRNPADLAVAYRRQGLSRQLAWNAFVRDTILQPAYRSEAIDARAFFSAYDKVGGAL